MHRFLVLVQYEQLWVPTPTGETVSYRLTRDGEFQPGGLADSYPYYLHQGTSHPHETVQLWSRAVAQTDPRRTPSWPCGTGHTSGSGASLWRRTTTREFGTEVEILGAKVLV